MEFLAGPAFGDIMQGCEIPRAPKVAVCPPGQFGCQGWPSYATLEYPEYINSAQHDVGDWTGDMHCGEQTGGNNGNWLDQSIVETATGQPSFNYPSTSMVGWLCASSDDGTYNSSSPQGEIFFEQFAQPSQLLPNNYDVYAVYTCHEDEEVATGTVSSLPSSPSGFTAITNDMIGAPSSQTVACTKNPGH